MGRMIRVLLVTALVWATFPVLGEMPTAMAVPVTVVRQVTGIERAVSAASVEGEDVLSTVTQAPIPFSLIAFEHPLGGELEVRTSSDGDDWSAWHHAEPEPMEAPDDASLGRTVHTSPLWVDEARFVQIRTQDFGPEDVTMHVVDSLGLSTDETVRIEMPVEAATSSGSAAYAVPRPAIISRAGWGADESIRKGDPNYSLNANFGVLHHTAGSNDYTEDEAAAVVRGIYTYHVKSRGWSDIGYNLLVDRFGNVYEGRAGGVERAVIGAHTYGFNTDSFGVAVMGNFDQVEAPQNVRYQLSRVFAWKFGVHEIDPSQPATAKYHGNTTSKFTKGQTYTVDPLSTHRDLGSTSCPGQYLYNRLSEIRSMTASLYTFDFDDISGLSHADNITTIARHGITVGCKDGRSYCPHNDVTRAQMATFLVRATRSIEPRWGQDFTDVPTTHTHGADINGILDAELTQSCNSASGGDRFCPERGVTRAEMATFLVRAIPALEPNPEGNRFADVPWESSHRPAINAIADAGITVGCKDKTVFCPDHVVTRAEMATFIARALSQGIRTATS